MATSAQNTRARPRTRTATRAGAALIALVGLIHLIEAPDQFSEAAWLGVLFLASVAGSALVAARLWRRDDARAWALGAVVAVCCLAGYVWSRTSGLPGMETEAWDALGIASLVVEAGFIGLALSRIRRAAFVSD